MKIDRLLLLINGLMMSLVGLLKDNNFLFALGYLLCAIALSIKKE